MINLTAYIALVAEWMGAIAVAMLAGISPRFKHRPIQFVYPRREINLSLAMFASIIALAFIIYAIYPPQTDGLPIPQFVVALLSAAPFALALRYRGQPIRSAGWNPQYLRAALMLGLALALLAMFLRGQIMTILSVKSERWMILLVMLGIAAAEESIFRGYIQIRLMPAWGRWWGIAATALLFALWQLPLLLTAGSAPWDLMLVSLVVAFARGLVYGYIASQAGHVLPVVMYRAVSEWLMLL